MNQPSAADRELISLKRKLDKAITNGAELENALEHKTQVLTQFITKLSLIAKGIDVVLDNKLADLRKKLSNIDSWKEIEDLIVQISQILQKHSIKNDRNIDDLHAQFHQASLALQKISELPKSLKAKLKKLVSETNVKKDAPIQYVPALAQLIEFYQLALEAKNAPNKGGLLANTTQKTPKEVEVDRKIIDRFSLFLSNLNVSAKFKTQVTKIRADLSTEISYDALMESFLTIFEIINKDLINERKTAKVFLSTLSETLTSVQTAVQSTIISNEEAKAKHNKLNKNLQNKIIDVAKGLNEATSLVDIKTEINEKLKHIAAALEEKTSFEFIQYKELQLKLSEMQTKVSTLEDQGRSFEKRIQEQQARSMQDSLTKLGNRAAFDECFAKKIVRFHHTHYDLAIVVIDLDDFKRINDTYGHTAGDKTLQVIAKNLAKDNSKDIFVGRYGGEEFVMIISNLNQAALQRKLEDIRLRIAKLPFKFKDTKVSITLSIGATHVQKEDNVHIAFERADEALYQAKKNGKNQVVYT